MPYKSEQFKLIRELQLLLQTLRTKNVITQVDLDKIKGPK